MNFEKDQKERACLTWTKYNDLGSKTNLLWNHKSKQKFVSIQMWSNLLVKFQMSWPQITADFSEGGQMSFRQITGHATLSCSAGSCVRSVQTACAWSLRCRAYRCVDFRWFCCRCCFFFCRWVSNRMHDPHLYAGDIHEWRKAMHAVSLVLISSHRMFCSLQMSSR